MSLFDSLVRCHLIHYQWIASRMENRRWTDQGGFSGTREMWVSAPPDSPQSFLWAEWPRLSYTKLELCECSSTGRAPRQLGGKGSIPFIFLGQHPRPQFLR